MTQQTQTKQSFRQLDKININSKHFYFDFKGKIVRISIITNSRKLFLANCNLFGIKVGNLFFDELNEKEKVLVLWHEYYHKINNLKMIPFFFLKGLFGLRFNPFHKLEFEADKFSALNNSIGEYLILLNHIKKISIKYKFKYEIITHPNVDERIKFINQFKNETTNTN
jgi:hypothetical protein